MDIARWLAIGVLAAGLAGCASGPRVVTAEVRANAAQGPGAALLQAVHYRFDPQPPVAGQPAPAQVEALAQAALARVGAVRDDAQARVSVQASASVQAGWSSAWAEPSNTRIALGFGGGWRGGGVGFGWGWGGPLGWDDSVPIYISEVSLVMRDVHSGQIVYDTRARHDGTWSNTGAVLAALFAAALQGYPNPPQGPQRVDVPMLLAPEAPPALRPTGDGDARPPRP